MSTGVMQLAATPDAVAPDPSKHVNYTFGMLLGVDDFKQEFAYLAGRDQWMARDLIGYGTISGLKVSLDVAVKGPRVSVSCGDALSPKGQMIRVCPSQCAYLNDWLNANQTDVQAVLGTSPPGSMIKLWLALCYRDCPVDPVPIAGEPCRSADDLMAPSRLVDDFRLELRLTQPLQQEEDAIRDFVLWLDQIQITDAPGSFPTIAQFEDALRAALIPVSSPLNPATYFHFGSPLTQFHIHPSHIGDYLKSAFRIWATEIRPMFHSGWPSPNCSCAGETSQTSPPEDCLMLAEVDVPVVNIGPGQNWQVDSSRQTTLDESQRPILLHTRLLQEWMQSGLRGGK
ncbi:MAG TPA: hypothetical protein VE604_11320 [Candidatus Polarisedimenticolia bacterium]|jgi:hypothetical protein|nr:hypothetical protein [Candidatus Polarisedimenticolia bacterium]